jgi:hypothetical protein
MVGRSLGRKLMKKKVIGLTLGALLFALGFAAEAQQPNKIPRIGFLSSNTGADTARFDGIR